MGLINQLFDASRRFEIKYAEYLRNQFRFMSLPGDVQVDLEREFVPVRELDLALKENSRVLLTGAPGSGKTTALSHLALTCAPALANGRRDTPVPVHFSAHNINNQSLLHVTDLPRLLGMIDCPTDYFVQALTAKRLLVLIDDIDALSLEAQSELVHEFSSARIVATARDSIAEWFDFQLPLWRDQDIEKYARLKFGSQANAFTAALKASGVPRSLTSKPMTMAMLAHEWGDTSIPPAPLTKGGDIPLHEALGIKPLPTRRTALFDAYAQAVIGNDDETKRMLEGVALAMQRKKPARDEFVPKSRGFLRAATNHTCDFVHELWRVYFAARAARRAPDLTTIEEHLENPAWRDVILFYAGLGDASELVSALMASGDVILAGYAIAHAKELSAELKESVTKELVAMAWDGDASAAAVLGEMQSDATVTALAAKLKDPDPTVRARAAEVLGQLQLDRALEYLLPQMRDVNADARDAVIHVLGRSLSNRVIEPLLSALRGDPRAGIVDTRLRVAAAGALGEVGSDKAVPALIVDLTTGEPEVRPAAADALKRIGSPLMVKPLKGVLQSGDEEARKHAAEILASMNGNGS